MYEQIKTKLNLGCGKDIKQGFINLDAIKGKGVDVVCDLNKGKLPFKNNTFERIDCINILEHVENRMKLIDEMWRVSKKDGLIFIKVPYCWCNGAIEHIEHKSLYDLGSFNYYICEDLYSGLKANKTRFEIISKRRKVMPNARLRKLLPFKNFLAMFLINIYDELYFELKVVK